MGNFAILPRSHDYLNSIDHIIRLGHDPDEFADAVIKSMREHMIVQLSKDDWRDIADAVWDDVIRGGAAPLQSYVNTPSRE